MTYYKSKRNKFQQKNHALKLSLSEFSLEDYFIDKKQVDKITDHKKKTNKISSVFQHASTIRNEITSKNGSDYYEKKGDKMFTCAQYLTYAISSNVDKKLIGVYRCGSRFCSICQNFHINRRISYIQKGIVNSDVSVFEKIDYVFLTLTVKNPPVEDLKKTLKHMNESFQRLVERKAWKDVVVGFVKSTEVSKGDVEGCCHPHFHIIIAVKPSFFKRNYRSHAVWVAEWHDCLKYSQDELPSVFIKRIRSDYDYKTEPALHLEQILHENIKYSIKPSDLLDDVGFFIKLEDELRGAQFFQTNGLFKKLFKLGQVSFEKERAEENKQVVVDVLSFFFKKKYRKINLTDEQKIKMINDANKKKEEKTSDDKSNIAEKIRQMSVFGDDCSSFEVVDKVDEKIKKLDDDGLVLMSAKTCFTIDYYKNKDGGEREQMRRFEAFQAQLAHEIELRKQQQKGT